MKQTKIRRFAVIPVAAAASIALAACGGQAKPSTGAGSASGGSSGAYGSSGGYGTSSGASSSSASSQAPSAGSTSLRLASTSKGKLLVDSKGFTAYLFTADHGSTDQCMKVKGCTSVWPPLTVKGHPSAGSGLKKSMLGTIKLPNGTQQLTYAGHPLYGYTGDSSPASTSYIGITSYGGTWLAVSPTGTAVH